MLCIHVCLASFHKGYEVVFKKNPHNEMILKKYEKRPHLIGTE